MIYCIFALSMVHDRGPGGSEVTHWPGPGGGELRSSGAGGSVDGQVLQNGGVKLSKMVIQWNINQLKIVL